MFVCISKERAIVNSIRKFLSKNPEAVIAFEHYSCIKDFISDFNKNPENFKDTECIFSIDFPGSSSDEISELQDIGRLFPNTSIIFSAGKTKLRELRGKVSGHENHIFLPREILLPEREVSESFLSVILENSLLRKKLNNIVNELESEKEKSREKISQFNETILAKEKFISLISHDIKDPLLAISEITKIINTSWETISDAEKQEIIEEIHRSSSKTYQLVESLTGWSRKTSAAVIPAASNFNISKILQQSIDIANSVAGLKTIKIFNDVKEDVLVNVDENMIFTVFRNLLLNAVKYSPEGGNIKISVEKRNSFYQFCVSDNGKGIDNQCIIELFKRGHELFTPESIVKNGNGQGIGLLICKEFIEKNGGQIWLETKKDAGSRFYFTIPG